MFFVSETVIIGTQTKVSVFVCQNTLKPDITVSHNLISSKLTLEAGKQVCLLVRREIFLSYPHHCA